MFTSNSIQNHSRHYVVLILALVGLISAATLLLGPSSAQAVAPSWSFTGSLNAARVNHTATLLLNGKVLVAGGSNYNPDGGVIKSAELYDPSTGFWSYTGNLNTSRYAHTATLLLNGKVLVAGGYDGRPPNILNSAELYDPATGTWSFTGNLNTPRAGWHTATLLPNGKVLVVGGVVDNNGHIVLTNSAELYDPATGMWTSTGNLNTEHLAHTATLLPNGKVLVAGVSNLVDGFFNFVNSAELYDSTTGMWSYTSNLNTARELHTATLLHNGKVLFAGGDDLNCEVFCPSNSAELYDPATGTWASTGNLNSNRYGHTATLLSSGKVLVFGGPGTLNTAELYDPATGTWSITAGLNTSRLAPSTTLLRNGKLLVAGGNVSGRLGTLNSAELYEPGVNSTPNQIDDTQFFVSQHYRDFLSREPDPDGLNFWTGEIYMCGADPQCIEVKRINDSASFFLSIEFQETGYLVYRFYKCSYGNLPAAPVPVKLSEFWPDTQQIGQGVIVNQAGWEQVLESNKQAFATEFVQRSRFTSTYPTSMTPSQFVDTLFANAEVTPSATDRALAINEFGAASTTTDYLARQRALRRIVDNSTLKQQEFNRAFVLMQYFGYLRRNPNDAPDGNFDGYNFWLKKLDQFNGNYIQAEMVKAFLSSIEYRRRFGP